MQQDNFDDPACESLMQRFTLYMNTYENEINGLFFVLKTRSFKDNKHATQWYFKETPHVSPEPGSTIYRVDSNTFMCDNMEVCCRSDTSNIQDTIVVDKTKFVKGKRGYEIPKECLRWPTITTIVNNPTEAIQLITTDTVILCGNSEEEINIPNKRVINTKFYTGFNVDIINKLQSRMNLYQNVRRYVINNVKINTKNNNSYKHDLYMNKSKINIHEHLHVHKDVHFHKVFYKHKKSRIELNEWNEETTAPLVNPYADIKDTKPGFGLFLYYGPNYTKITMDKNKVMYWEAYSYLLPKTYNEKPFIGGQRIVYQGYLPSPSEHLHAWLEVIVVESNDTSNLLAVPAWANYALSQLL